METAITLKYRPDNPCRRVQVPSGEKPEDEARFLTQSEFGLLRDSMADPCRVFSEFLVMTGMRFGEATAVTGADVELLAKPATVRVNKAWKRDGSNSFYVGVTKTGAGKWTIAVNPGMVDHLVPLVASRTGDELLFVSSPGGRSTPPFGATIGYRLSGRRRRRGWQRTRASTTCGTRMRPG
ncbi:hypothetical protein [Specibacter cremeus]|uniref:hypothetical protein n=1 Tax=Specibacter cremeus TaxID=1629051 RepID=UPI001F0C1CFE|nr:hypothetical protein [Specibacter cremeus]